MKLTAKAVEKLRHNPAKGRQEDIKDDGTPGLYLRLYQTGRKSWIYRYKLRGKVRILTLGDCKQMGLAEARKEARKAHDQVRGGRWSTKTWPTARTWIMSPVMRPMC